MTDSCSSSGSTYALGEYSSRTRHLATALDDDYYDAGGDGATTTLDGGLKAPRCSPALWLLLLLLLLLIALATLLYSPKGQLLQGESAAPLSLSSFLPHTHTLSLSLYTHLDCAAAGLLLDALSERFDATLLRRARANLGRGTTTAAARRGSTRRLRAIAKERAREEEREKERRGEDRRRPPLPPRVELSRCACMLACAARAGRAILAHTSERARCTACKRVLQCSGLQCE